MLELFFIREIYPPMMEEIQLVYENCDEPIQYPKIRFKPEFFYWFLDVTLNSLEERFLQLRNSTDNLNLCMTD
jgi:hypothetical protein